MQCVGNDYEYGSDLIGHGAFAVVYKGRQISTGQAVAVKQILLKNIPGKLSNMRQKEIAILKELKHPNIVQLFDCYETKVELYIIMEFCNGGDLADYLQVKKTLSEDSIKHLSIHIASALVFIHKQHIIHRDIKPQNILLTFPSRSGKQFKDACIKIADFGFARHLYEADMAATVCGSPIYMAPEILIGHRYDSKADMWSTGVIIYQCLTGETPFRASDPHSLRKQYIRNALVPRIPHGVSSLLSDLLLSLIKKSPQERMSQEEFKSHPFLQPNVKCSLEESSPLLHARSSPVPINRRPQPASSPNSSYSKSPKQHSPHSGGQLSFGSSQKGFSASSGPPSLHRIATNSSLHKYYSSPPTNVTDEGFILVGTPGAQQQGSFSPCSVEGSPGTSSSQSSSPLLTHHHLHDLFYSPTPSTADHHHQHHRTASSPISTGAANTGTNTARQGFLLSHTPPFSSLVRTGSLNRSLSGSHRQQPNQASSTAMTPPSLYMNSPESPSPRSNYTRQQQHQQQYSLPVSSTSPGKRSSLPGSRKGSGSKLSTLVESCHEENDRPGKYMVDSTDMITPSLLLESDILRNELEKLSDPNHPKEGHVFGLLKSKEELDDDRRKFARGGLSLSQELADIRKRDVSLNQKRHSLFLIGDSSDEPDMSPDQPNKGDVPDYRVASDSPTSPEELFSFQLEDEGESSPVNTLQQSILLANELLRIAKTRQGPMLLLSSSMGDSGSGMVDHVVRFSEQLVLCTKAAIVVRDGVRQYFIANAVSSNDSSDSHVSTVLAEAQTLETLCLEKARIARDLYHKCLAKRRRHSLPHASVTAEKLIFFQAADLCKQGLLEERSNRKEDCMKKYCLAIMLLRLLQSDAKSSNDRSIIKKYIILIQHRQQLMTST